MSSVLVGQLHSRRYVVFRTLQIDYCVDELYFPVYLYASITSRASVF